MKRCNACEEEFADRFSFCPVDGSPLNDLAAELVGREWGEMSGDERLRAGVLGRDEGSRAGRPCHDESPRAGRPCHDHDFQVTMLSSTSLGQRLTRELSFAIAQLKEFWPEFKKEPITVAGREINSLLTSLRALARPNALAGLATAILLVLAAALSLVLFGRGRTQTFLITDDNSEIVEMISLLPTTMPSPEGAGVGASSDKGRVGFNQGKGQGSEKQQQDARGGGGSGKHDPKPASPGKVQVASAIPAPISPPLPHPSLPEAGIDLDPALWRNLPFAAYGDPRSRSTLPSKGPGDGGAIGSGQGLGNGSGRGNGFGPGEDGNIGGGKKGIGSLGPGGSDGDFTGETNRIFRTLDVTQRARVIAKPEPQYTEAARRGQITGSVVLSVVFSDSGQVTNIRVVKGLPEGLTEKAIAAARLIRFAPALRNGQPVSVYMQLEYNFNLY
jgi:TonB family protein